MKLRSENVFYYELLMSNDSVWNVVNNLGQMSFI